MYIKQKQLENIKKDQEKNKVFVIYGPRRCGKNNFVKTFFGKC